MQFRGIHVWRNVAGCVLAAALTANASLIIQLRVVEGEGAVYRSGARANRGLTVLVTDENGVPVENASVSFRLPEQGATGLFHTGLRTEVVTTGVDGRATISGMQWNKTPGPVEIKITAVKDQARAGIVTTQYVSDTVAFKSVAPSSPAPALAPKAPAPKSAPAPAKALVSTAKVSDLATPGETTAGSHETSASLATAPKAGGEGVFTASHKGHKWLWIAAIAGGGAAAGMKLGHPRSSSSGVIGASTAPGGISIGTPSITVGHP